MPAMRQLPAETTAYSSAPAAVAISTGRTTPGKVDERPCGEAAPPSKRVAVATTMAPRGAPAHRLPSP